MKKIYLKEVQQSEDNITSLSGMSEKLCSTQEFSNVSLETMRGRMRRAGEKAFGITLDETSRGLYGSREYMWAVKLYDAPNHYRYLTIEEEQIFDTLVSNFYSTNPERVKKAALLEEAFKSNNEMTKEEYFKEKERLNLNVFYDVIKLFKQETGLQVVHATAHDIDEEYMDGAW